MKNYKDFNSKVLRTIEECSYDFFIVQQDKKISCSCTEHSTKQADPKCKKCLGTGHKIIIRQIKGACNTRLKGDSSLGIKASHIVKKYFVINKFDIKEDDYFVDDNEIYYIYRIERKKGLKGEYTHNEVTTVKLKNDHDIVLNNFYNIINTYNKRK